MKTFTIEVHLVEFDTGPMYLAEMKRDGNKWTLRIDPNHVGSRKELNEVINRQLQFAAIQLASAAASGHVWPAES